MKEVNKHMSHIKCFFKKSFWTDIIFWIISGLLSFLPVIAKELCKFISNTYSSGDFIKDIFITTDGSYIFLVLTIITFIDYCKKMKKNQKVFNGFIIFSHITAIVFGTLVVGIMCTLNENSINTFSENNILKFNIVFAISIFLLDILTYIYVNNND